MRIVLSGWTLDARRRRLLQAAVRAALGARARRKGVLCVVLVSDREILTLNRRLLGHDYPTDVISVGHQEGAPMPVPRGIEPPFGDVYVARDVARRQAREAGRPWFEELLTLAVHGTLHLVGYDDGAPAAKRRMFARQDRLVRRALDAL